jgi:hypothetical protein
MNDASRIDDEQSTFARAIFFVVNTVGARDRSFRFEIGQKREAQPVLPGLSRMTPRAVHRDAQDFGLKFLKLIQHFVVERHLITAHRTPVGRVKREHHRAAAELPQRYRLVRCASQCELGSRRADRQERSMTVGVVLGLRGRTHKIYGYMAGPG